jgi:uncharacterized coiled-coil DUF342 family protein
MSLSDLRELDELDDELCRLQDKIAALKAERDAWKAAAERTSNEADHLKAELNDSARANAEVRAALQAALDWHDGKRKDRKWIGMAIRALEREI